MLTKLIGSRVTLYFIAGAEVIVTDRIIGDDEFGSPSNELDTGAEEAATAAIAPYVRETPPNQIIEGELTPFQPGRIVNARRLSDKLPLNELGLPTGIYRTDLIPDGEAASIDELAHAYIPLSYAEGFPSAGSGIPFWRRFEFEPVESYQLFDLYIRQPSLASDGARVLDDLPELAAEHLNREVSSDYVHEQYEMFYWTHRAKAYDLFRIAAKRRQSELRAMEANDSHYRRTEQLLHRLEVYMDDEEDFWDLMTPKVAIDFFKTLVQVQRVSTGQPAASPPPEGEEGKGQSFEMILRTIAQGSNTETAGGETDQHQAIDRALADPRMAEMAQELIIRLNQ